MAGFSAKTADFFLLTDLVLFLLPDFLLLVVVVNIHSQTEKYHNGNGNGSYVHTIYHNVPNGESDSYAK